MKDLDNLHQFADEDTDINTGAEQTPLPKRPRGRPKGSKNKLSAGSREVLEEWGAKITEAACRWAVGKPIVRINAKGQREKVYPSGDQMQTSQKLVLERLVAVRRHTELVGAGGKDLHPNPPSVRDLSRAVLSVTNILRTAQIEEAESEAEAEAAPTPAPPEQLLLTRDVIIEHQASDPPFSAPAAAQGEAPGALSGSPAASPDKPDAPDPPDDPDEQSVFANGAQVAFDAERGKWLVLDSSGHLHGMRRDRSEAAAYAQTLPTSTLLSHAGRDQPPTDHAAPAGRADQRAFGPRRPNVLRRQRREP